jgi:hypothetical protein
VTLIESYWTYLLYCSFSWRMNQSRDRDGRFWCLLAIYVPGTLLMFSLLPFGKGSPSAVCAGYAQGANAAVVGVLWAALYQPVWTSAIRGSLTSYYLGRLWPLDAMEITAVKASRWPELLLRDLYSYRNRPRSANRVAQKIRGSSIHVLWNMTAGVFLAKFWDGMWA